jgi:iron complex outermembrane receptor protein
MVKAYWVFAGCLGLVVASGPALAAEAAAPADEIIVTARLRPENAQTVPEGLTVIGQAALTQTLTYDMAQIGQLAPAVNYNSPNPRNTSLTIRGLGSSVVAIAQANDGLEPGVGFYVDQVYHARPATAAFDFLDVERVEVLRGPQGTVFGKNTTAGAINITTKAPSFTPEAEAELSYGDYGYVQAKGTLSGPLYGDKVAGRLSMVGTFRDGVIDNVKTGQKENTIDNFGVHAQLLVRPLPQLTLRLSADNNAFNGRCCTQVFVRVGTDLKAAANQYPALAAGLGYSPPSTNPYDRLTDIDATLKTRTNEGGVSNDGEYDLGAAKITSVTAWRWWNWDAANDRDYTGVPIQLLQHIPSRQDQYSQELRIGSNGRRTFEYVAGLYWFRQVITGTPITGYGPLATYWLLGPTSGNPSNLLDGYTTSGHTRFDSSSYAAFGEVTWHATDRFSLTGGLRYTIERKSGGYSSVVFGGANPTTTAQANAKLSILRPQSYAANVDDHDLSGRMVAAYNLTDKVMAYASYARTGKSGGINMSGLALNAQNLPALNTAVVKPEKNITYEIGFKSQLLADRLTLNLDYFNTEIRDFQTNVVDSGPGALRGYLANIDLVRDQGVELDSSFQLTDRLSGHLSGAWTDGKYVSYKNGPCPLELIGSSTAVCDLSGRPLSGLPHWAWSAGGEYRQPATLAGTDGEAYLHLEASYRTSQYGDPTDSKYTLLDGYGLLNASLGFRARAHWEALVWARNLLGANYLQNVTVQAGNSGLVVGTPGDPRTFGFTLRARY